MPRAPTTTVARGILDSLTTHEDGYTCQAVISTRVPVETTDERYNIGFRHKESFTLSCNGTWLWNGENGQEKIQDFKTLLDRFLGTSNPVMVYLTVTGYGNVYEATFMEMRPDYVSNAFKGDLFKAPAIPWEKI